MVDRLPSAPRTFRLTRFFSLSSLVGMLVVTACLFWVYRELSLRHLVEHETRANVDLTRAFANAVWSQYRPFVLASAGRSRESLSADPAVRRLRADVLDKMRGLQIAKLKVYNLAGVTVFSTDAQQIGEDKSDNAVLVGALGGAVSSQITFRERFDAFEGTLNNRSLIASYVPIRATAGAPVEGVFEVYSDVTDLLAAQTRAQWQVAGVVFGLLGLLYLGLSLVVRKADLLISNQERERAEREQLARHQADHDQLTGLPHRGCFAECLPETLARAGRHRNASGLMLIDLDRFKIVNDSLGHEAGDRLLQAVAERMTACLRGSDRLFRMGGDEFAVLLPEIQAPEDAGSVARRIMEALAAPVQVDGRALTVGATIGIALYPGDGDRAEALLKNADAAMYAAKQAGRGQVAFYRPSMNQRASQRLELESALKTGFHNGEFLLHYQPRVDARSHRVVALEALLRWKSPERGLVPPGEFIGVLEDTGMMPIVGEWVLRTACTQLRRWHDAGRPPLRVSVNVSPVQFQNPAFVDTVRRVLRETNAPPDLIELELTESLLIANPEQARTTIGALKATGLRLSIDDFGTGFSSLNYLRLFAVDCLKIDRSFTAELATDPRARAVVSAIIDLAAALGIGVVAEGVETEAQAAFFSDAGCGELQGFLFCHPLPAEQLARRLAGSELAVPAG